MFNKLIEIRTKLILGAIGFALSLQVIKCFAFGGWPFHFPEIEGGTEVTFENMKNDEERHRAKNKEYPYTTWEKDAETGKWIQVHHV